MKQRADLTFKHNRDHGRHGWLRLTPAYSVKLVEDILSELGPQQTVLEPFSGTGTTAVVAAKLGSRCRAFDINPFLIWLGEAKTRNYSDDQRIELLQRLDAVTSTVPDLRGKDPWLPPISGIERWWSSGHLSTLAALFAGVQAQPDDPVTDLLKVAFCRVMIDWSNAAFNHQSMSFKQPDSEILTLDDEPAILDHFASWCRRIAADVSQPLQGTAAFTLGDSRTLLGAESGRYTAVVTSPPYPNRMSYVRELRPYMYWLGFLKEAREAGELDWQAIGGTWGCATSRVGQWVPSDRFPSDHAIHQALQGIASHSELLSKYVHKYFEDMLDHFEAVTQALRAGGQVFYVVGNSKFYDTVLEVEQLYASMMRRAGLSNVEIHKIRKRNSKKELYEFVVTATKGRRRGITLNPNASPVPRAEQGGLSFT